jgi:hypothetical protein
MGGNRDRADIEQVARLRVEHGREVQQMNRERNAKRLP